MLLVVAFPHLLFAQKGEKEPLLRIVQNGRVGFIDLKGNLVIKPEYKQAGTLHDGLIPIRKNGTFGYIDRTGAMVIPDIYDYAEDFSNGLAKVYFHGDPRYIRTDGSRLRVFGFKYYDQFSDGIAIVKTYRNTFGLIDSEGTVILDTIYSYIHRNPDGNFAVTAHFFSDDFLALTFDPKRKRVLPPEKNFSISTEYKVDSNFNITYHLDDYHDHRVATFESALPVKISNGLFVATKNKPGQDVTSSKRQSIHDKPAIISIFDTIGHILYSGSDYLYVSDFHNNRAIAIKGDSVCLITPLGTIAVLFTSLHPQDNIRYDNFYYHNGYYVIRTTSGNCLIDSVGNVIIPPSGYFTFTKNPLYISKGRGEGFSPEIVDIRTGNGFPIPPVWKENAHSTDEALLLDSGDMYQYITYTGKMLYKWQSWTQSSALEEDQCYKFNSFYQYDLIDTPRAFHSSEQHLSLTAEVTTNTANLKSAQPKKTIVLSLINGLKDSIILLSHSYILQALNDSSVWQDVEVLSQIGCSVKSFNFYRNEELVVGPQLMVLANRTFPHGAKKVKCRIRVDIRKDTHSEEVSTLYSNEFDGFINPAQFWREDHDPNLWGDYSIWN